MEERRFDIAVGILSLIHHRKPYEKVWDEHLSFGVVERANPQSKSLSKFVTLYLPYMLIHPRIPYWAWIFLMRSHWCFISQFFN